MRMPYGVRILVANAFAPMPGETIVLLVERPVEASALALDQLAMAQVWHREIAGMAGPLGFFLEPVAYLEHLDTSASPAGGTVEQAGRGALLSAFLDRLGPKHVLIAISQRSLRAELDRRIARQRFRAGTVTAAPHDLSGFWAGFDALASRASTLADALERAERAEIRFSPGGEELVVDLRGQAASRVNDGTCTEPGKRIDLPGGLLQIAPAPVDDDDATPQSEGRFPMQAGELPLVATVEQGRLVGLEGDAAAREPMAARLGLGAGRGLAVTRIGFGFNPTAEPTGLASVDDKVEGLSLIIEGRDEPLVVYCGQQPAAASVTLVRPGGSTQVLLTDGGYPPDLFS